MTDAGETLFLSIDTTITCPECDKAFTLAQGFAKNALEKIEARTRDALAEREAQIKAEVERRATQIGESRDQAAREEIAELKQLADEQIRRHREMLEQVRIAERKSAAAQAADLQKSIEDRDARLTELKSREAVVEAKAREIDAQVAAAAHAQAAKIIAVERESFNERIAAKSAQVAALQIQEIVLRKARQKLEEDQAAMALEVARQVDAGRQEADARARAQELEKAKLREADLQKKLDDLSDQLSVAQRKAEQGSQQLQGEVLELAVENALRRTFPADTIEEVKKGARGGDVVHRIVSRTLQPAGIILWETKRAKDWSPQWAQKLKEDMRAAGADLGVIVTMACPKEFENGQLFGLHEDIWVTSWSTSMHLAQVLRAGLLDVHKQRLASAGKGEKMEAVYDYLTSPQFAQKLKAVYGSFELMREELNKERASTEQRWARREKQIGLAMKELVGIAGDVQGLAQQELPQLELDQGDS